MASPRSAYQNRARTGWPPPSPCATLGGMTTTGTTAVQAAIDYERIAAAIRFIDEAAGRQPSLDELAEHVGLSRSHLQRTFKRWAGTSPKRFLQFLTAHEARHRLERRQAVLDAAIGAGLSSPGRLHDLMVTIDAMTPGEVARGGAGLTLAYGTHPTGLGRIVVAVSDRGVSLLRFVDGDADPVMLVRERWPSAQLVLDPDRTWRAVAPAFESGHDTGVRLHVRGTNLQLKVWEALLSIRPGEISTYGEIAASVGRPRAVRAVGSAVARNPVAYLIPCHRVIRATGQLGGYAWGLERKRLLLAREAAQRRAMS